MKRALVLVVLVACQRNSTEHEKLGPVMPSKKLVQAMVDYCHIGNMPADKVRDAQALWGFQNGGDPEVGPIWNKAAKAHDPMAIKTLYAAADQAVGVGKCPILDVLTKYVPR